MNARQFQALYEHGVDRVAISLDAVTPNLFDEIKGDGVKGPFSWRHHIHALDSARSVFGPGRATTHLIIGLGETEFQTVHLIHQLVTKDITVGLFPFTPIPGTPLASMKRPILQHYRRIQLAHYLFQNRLVALDQIQYNSSQQITKFDLPRETLTDIIARGKAFQTAGCPSCNRPYFTEQPGGPIYNYPKEPTEQILKEIEYQLAGVL
jgi:biotin synthase